MCVILGVAMLVWLVRLLCVCVCDTWCSYVGVACETAVCVCVCDSYVGVACETAVCVIAMLVWLCVLYIFLCCRPYSLFMNPLEMDSAEVRDSISLDANEVLVVYQRERESGGVMRRVQHGPTVFTPSADEWSVESN